MNAGGRVELVSMMKAQEDIANKRLQKLSSQLCRFSQVNIFLMSLLNVNLSAKASLDFLLSLKHNQ